MNNFILIENDESLSKILERYLFEEFYANTVVLNCPDQTVKYLNQNKVDLIICRNYFTRDDEKIVCSNKIFNYSYDHSVPLIIIGDDDHISGFVNYLPDQFRPPELKRMIVKIMGYTKEEMQFFSLPEYVPILIANLYLVPNAISEIYILIQKKVGDQYIKRFNTGDSLDKEIIKKYENKSVENFYIKKEDYQNMLNNVLEQSFLKLKETKSESEFFVVASDSFEMIKDLLIKVGINNETVKFSNETLKTMMGNTLVARKSLTDHLNKMTEEATTFSFRKSYILMALSNYVISFMDWGSLDQKKLIFKKLCFVSFFHDILLPNEKLQKINNLKALRSDEITKEEKELVLNHANLTSTFIQSYPHIPSGADIIIREHHGSSSGTEFPERYTSGLSEISICFIVLESLSFKLVNESREPFDFLLALDKSIKELEEQFSLPSYRKILEIFKSNIFK